MAVVQESGCLIAVTVVVESPSILITILCL